MNKLPSWKRGLALAILLVLALVLAWLSPQPKPVVTAPVVQTQGPAGRLYQALDTEFEKMEANFNPAPRPQAETPVVDLFAPAIAAPVPELVNLDQAAPKPQAPPLPFRFIGRIADGTGTRFFLEADDILYAVKVGDVFAERYQLTRDESGKLSLRYLPLNITQTMTYGEAP